MSGPSLTWAPAALNTRIGILFMIGSFCFALGSAPGLSSVAPPSVLGPIFFIGSLFFTSAGYLQYVQSINLPLAGSAPVALRLAAWQPRSLRPPVVVVGEVFYVGAVW